ncbi:hypothetical protein ACIQ6Y_31135 [Streptomyces sp. NPDC096205]|uniref:hypothetical protein n=1 Tax=Streptomyces sp. NPDC096205 TaxID=3366081 RepID=UPI003800B75C
MTDTTATTLLPIGGATLATDTRVLDAVRAIGARYGVDYTNDKAVTALLAERRRAVRATQRGWFAWIGGLALTAGVVLPMLSTALPDRTAKAALLATGPVVVLAVAALTAVHVRWKRELTHPSLTGYREVLGVARAHGLPLTHVPAWLEGRSSTGGGKASVPIPSYPSAEPRPSSAPPSVPTAVPTMAEDTPAQPVTVPPKPAAVAHYEEIADAGGWHDETGCLLLFAALIGASWAWSQDVPLGYGLLALVPVAIAVWMAGRRQGREKEALRAEAVAYVRTVAAAQAAGAPVAELPPVLRELLED